MVLWPKLVIKVFLQGLMRGRGISQAEPPTGPQNEPYIRDSAFLWCGGFCVALFVLCVGFLRRSLGARFLFLSVRASDRMRTFNGSCVSLPHFRPAFASRTSVSAQLQDLKVVVNAGPLLGGFFSTQASLTLAGGFFFWTHPTKANGMLFFFGYPPLLGGFFSTQEASFTLAGGVFGRILLKRLACCFFLGILLFWVS